MAIPAVSGAVTRVELAPAAALFRSLGEPTRLAILRRLALGEARVGELVEEVGLAQSTVSKHLARLKECGLVDSEPVGRASLFRLSQPALIDLLASAETVLQAGGQAVALCPPTESAAAQGIPMSVDHGETRTADHRASQTDKISLIALARKMLS